jgi:hypothetical protein
MLVGRLGCQIKEEEENEKKTTWISKSPSDFSPV